jgi:hypothetical protein
MPRPGRRLSVQGGGRGGTQTAGPGRALDRCGLPAGEPAPPSEAFASLNEAFDPLANARYAARFLSALQATRGDWMLAEAHYHSQTSEYADAYRALPQAIAGCGLASLRRL